MDMLLDENVTGSPSEIGPIAKLPLHLSPPRLTRNHPNLADIEIGPRFDNLPDRAVIEPADGLDLVCRVPAHGPCHNAQVLSLGHLPRLQDGAHARSVDRCGFLHKDVLTRLDGRPQVAGSENRGACQDDVVEPWNLE